MNATVRTDLSCSNRPPPTHLAAELTILNTPPKRKSLTSGQGMLTISPRRPVANGDGSVHYK